MPKLDYEISLKEVAKQPIADVYGYVSREFGDPCFKLTRIELVDGTGIDVEGEHDMPYLCDHRNVLTLPETDEA